MTRDLIYKVSKVNMLTYSKKKLLSNLPIIIVGVKSGTYC